MCSSDLGTVASRPIRAKMISMARPSTIARGLGPSTSTKAVWTSPTRSLTAAASLAASVVRRELCDAEPLAAGALDETLSLWANFCDDVVDRLNDGEPLAEALDDAWVLGDGDDIDVDDEPDEVSCTAPRSDGDIHGDLCADT